MEMPTRRMAITNLHVSKREVKEKKQRGDQRSKNRCVTILEQLMKNIRQIIHYYQNVQKGLIPMSSHEQL